MEPIFIIGAAVAVLVAIIVGFARRMRRHRIAVSSRPLVQSRVSAGVETIKARETIPTAIEPQPTKRDEESGGEGSLLGRAELIEPPADEVPMAPSGSGEVCMDKTVGLPKGERETGQSPESTEHPESPIAGETQVSVEPPGGAEAALSIAVTEDAPSSPMVNPPEEEPRVSEHITQDLAAAKGSPREAFTQIGAVALDLIVDIRDVKEPEASASSVAGLDAAVLAAPIDCSAEAETERTALVQTEEAAESERDAPGEELTGAHKTTRSPRQYRPVVRTAPKPDVPSVPKDERVERARALSLEVRLVFEPGGFSRVSVLPQRVGDLPEQLVVSGLDGEVELAALQKDWYQDVRLADTGRLLRRGIEWKAALPEDRTVRWSLSGREVYILAPHDHLSGFVGAPRLVIGEQHVVLCAAERRADVLRAIELTGSPVPQVIAAADGMPTEWIGFRGVIPCKPVAPSLAGDIMDALCPLANTEIVLKGGIRIGRATWLKEYPPVIQLHGDGSLVELIIDGHEARKDESGAYTSPGWDLPGDHVIWSAGASRSYSISAGLESWDPWGAYGWSWGESSAEREFSRPAICGVLVRSPRTAVGGSRPVVWSGANPVFIGTGIGEIEVCRTPVGVRTDVAIGFPAFDPVWALPADALHSDKNVARVLLVGSPRLPEPMNLVLDSGSASKTRHARRDRALRARAWCNMILDAGRKGLQPEPNTAEVSALWKQYRRTAKLVWRAQR
jgi:hypothetical protein